MEKIKVVRQVLIRVVIPVVIPVPPAMEKVMEQKIVIHHSVFSENLNTKDFQISTTGGGTNQSDCDYHGCIRE